MASPGCLAPLLLALNGTVCSAGCVSNPLQARFEVQHFVDADPVLALAAVAQSNRICLAVEGLSGLAERISMDSAEMSFREFVKRAAPLHRVSVSGNIVHLRSKPAGGNTWLDLRLSFQTDSWRDVMFVSRVELYGTLLRRFQPNVIMAGDLLGSHEEVGPYDLHDMPVREILDRLLTDLSRGGAWVAKDLNPPSVRPALRPWELLPYSERLDTNRSNLGSFLYYPTPAKR